MRTPAFLLLLTCPALGGCAEQDSGWYRAASYRDGYMIAKADAVANTCMVLSVVWGERETPTSFMTESDIDVVGTDFYVSNALYSEDADECTTDDVSYSRFSRQAVGRIKFKDVHVDSTGIEVPCRVSVDLVIDVDDDTQIEMKQRNIPVRANGCPRPDIYAAELTELEAAYDAEAPRLLLSAWDAGREACVGHWFYEAALGGDHIELGIPDTPYDNLQWIAKIPRDECRATALLDREESLWPFVKENDQHSSGTISFVRSETTEGSVLVPCELDVDVSLGFGGHYYWTPDTVVMRATGVPVARACDE